MTDTKYSHKIQVKPNVGHSEGAAGLTSLIKGILALEHRMVPPNTKTAPGGAFQPIRAASRVAIASARSRSIGVVGVACAAWDRRGALLVGFIKRSVIYVL